MENSVDSDSEYLASELILFSAKKGYFCSARVSLIRLEADPNVLLLFRCHCLLEFYRSMVYVGEIVSLFICL